MTIAETKSGADVAGTADNARMRSVFDRQKAASAVSAAPSLPERVAALDTLLRLTRDHRETVAAAISEDFGHRSHHETLLSEVYMVVASIRHTRRHLKRWMKTRPVAVGWQLRPARAGILHQPLGVVGVISPWNYPFQLALLPLAAALAAGNRVMLKPSELTPRTSGLLARLLGEAFAEEQVAVVNGGPAVGEAFSRLPFDHLFYTGSTRVGRAIMRAAAENLTPVTLELGGKSPAIVGEDYAIDKAADAIAAGKLLNAGQTCIAPDYALVPAARVEAFAAAVEQAVRRLYPDLAGNPDYTSIVSDRHCRRIRGYVEEAQARGARVVEINPKGEDLSPGRKMAPTLVIEPDEDLALMQEEIFGPVLPVKGYRSLEEAVAYVNARPRPLAFYYFGNDQGRRDMVLNRTVAGGVTVNDTLTHFAVEDLPFGGVGASGMGQYHGYDGFATFSKRKGVFYQSAVNAAWVLRPPYGRLAGRVLKFLIGR